MAKGNEHDFVRALETHLKAIPWEIEIKFVWYQAFKWTVKTYTAGLSTKHYFIAILLMWALLNQGLWGFEMSWSPVLC